MNRELIKPYNQIFKTIELHNEIMRKYKQGVTEGTIFADEPVYDELEYFLRHGGKYESDELDISIVINGVSYTILRNVLLTLDDYVSIGILVEVYLDRAISLASKHKIPIRNEYHALLKKRYADICNLAEKITQQRIKDGVIGHLTVFAKTDAVFKNPATRAEFEDEFLNISGYCRADRAVEYYSAMSTFLKNFYA